MQPAEATPRRDCGLSVKKPKKNTRRRLKHCEGALKAAALITVQPIARVGTAQESSAFIIWPSAAEVRKKKKLFVKLEEEKQNSNKLESAAVIRLNNSVLCELIQGGTVPGKSLHRVKAFVLYVLRLLTSVNQTLRQKPR